MCPDDTHTVLCALTQNLESIEAFRLLLRGDCCQYSIDPGAASPGTWIPAQTSCAAPRGDRPRLRYIVLLLGRPPMGLPCTVSYHKAGFRKHRAGVCTAR